MTKCRKCRTEMYYRPAPTTGGYLEAICPKCGHTQLAPRAAQREWSREYNEMVEAERRGGSFHYTREG